MDRLSASWNTFKTGDVIITYYPERQRRPLHFTVFIEAENSKISQNSFMHSDQGVQLSPLRGYTKDMAGFLHARYTDNDLMQKAASAAYSWTQTAKPTPYGSEPNSNLFREKGDYSLTRYRAMRATIDMQSIPFDPPALLRAIKWTLRLMSRELLSKQRGITCAAFVVACIQAAAFQRYFQNLGVDRDKLAAGYKELQGWFGDKAAQRALLVQIQTNTKPPKSYGIGQALRINSNRSLLGPKATQLGQAKLTNKSYFQDENQIQRQNISDADALWCMFLEDVLGVNEWRVEQLADVLPEDMQMDAKYINSNILANHIKLSNCWAKTEYKEL